MDAFTLRLLLLPTVIQIVFSQSSIFLDWTFDIPQDLPVRHFALSYSPEIGISNETFPPNVFNTEINNTLPATDYIVVLRAILGNTGTGPFTVLNKTVPSSPDTPIIEKIEENCTQATLSFFPPDGDELTFYVEYYPIGREEEAEFQEFNDTIVTIEDLHPYTEYYLRLMAVFKGIPSRFGANTTFYTEFNGTNCNDSIVPYARPEEVKCIKEGKSMRITWAQPDQANCTSFRVNYTILTLKNPRSFQLDVIDRTYGLIKLYDGHRLKVEVYCYINESLAGRRPGITFADLRRPSAVPQLKLVMAETDRFYRTSALLAWKWPEYHNFDKFTVVMSYFRGTSRKLRKDIVVKKYQNSINITGLKPTETYTFTIRNISDFNIESRVKGIREIMPPIISSSLYEGEVTSNSIEINYSPTDVDDAKFETYELIFCCKEPGQNNTRRMASSDGKRAYTYTPLIPGKTYTFYLYTIYKNVRSRAVIKKVTTYPLRVKKVLPIVNREIVKLYWETEDTPITDIRYRIGYTGSDGSESEPLTLVNINNHTFDDLIPEVWYTFGVTVLMGEKESESASITAITGRERPPTPMLRRVSPTKMDIGFRPDFFTESNGIINQYSIIVAQDYRGDELLEKYPYWTGVQDYERWPAYQASEDDFNPFARNREQEVRFLIGSDSCEEVPEEEYCNGPLKPDTSYYVKIRACTKESICMETDYSKMSTDESLRRNSGMDVEYLNGRSSQSHLSISLISSTLLFLFFVIAL